MAKSNLEIIISAKDQTKGAISGIKGTLGSLGKLVGPALLTGLGTAAAAVGGIAAGVGVLAKQAAKLGPITDAFNAINASIGQNADEMLAALRNASGGLITNTDLMTNFNQAAQLVSKDFATQLPGAMEYLGKVAGATGQDLDYLLGSLVTGIGRLSPMILDNLGIQVDMTAAYEDYAATLGKSASELTKTEQQTALMNQVMEKLKTNTEGMAAIQDPFAQIGVAVTNLKDKVAGVIGPVVLPMFQQLADQLSTFVESDQFQQWLQQVSDWMVNNLVPAIQTFFTWVSEKVVPALQTFGGFITGTVIPALKSFWEFLQTYIFPVFEFLFDILGPIFKVAVDLFVGGWKLIFSIIKIVIDTIKKFIDNIKTAIETIKNFGQSIIDALPDWLIPGSPTPFELGIRGITAAIKDLSSVKLPPMAFAGVSPEYSGTAAGMGGGRGFSGAIHVTYSPAISLGRRDEIEAIFQTIFDNYRRKRGL